MALGRPFLLGKSVFFDGIVEFRRGYKDFGSPLLNMTCMAVAVGVARFLCVFGGWPSFAGKGELVAFLLSDE